MAVYWAERSGDAPLVSIVTPSFNQGRYLEETIRSLIEQPHRPVEHVVIDGGSTDGSVDLLRRYEDKIAYWKSEPDAGMYDAINKGFARTSGEIMGYLNSDDKLMPWALSVVADVFRSLPQVEWVTSLYHTSLDTGGRVVACQSAGGYSRRGFYRGAHLPLRAWYGRNFIQQDATFWRRSLWERAGGRVDDSMQLAGDFDLWARFFKHAHLYSINTPLGGFRRHQNQKTATQLSAYVQEAEMSLRRHGGRPYGRRLSQARHLLAQVIGERSTLHYPRIMRVLVALGLADCVPICGYRFDLGAWRIYDDYVV